MSAAPAPRRTGITLTVRLLALLLLILAVVATGFALVAGEVFQNARRQQLAEAREHFAARLRSTDQAWRMAAFSTRQQLDLWQADARDAPPPVREARLRALLVSLADQGDFTHAVVVDAGRQVLFRHDTRSQDVPPVPPAGAGWAFSERDRTVYRVVTGPVRFGGAPAQLVLYFPVDNALLGRLVYPGTRLTLLHAGRSVASAGGIASAAERKATDAAAEMDWDALPGAPRLRVDRSVVSPLSDRQLLWVGLACALAFVAIGWTVLGRWVAVRARRLHALQTAATAFAAAPAVSPAMELQLAQAEAPDDDIGVLARELRHMMASIEQGQAERARAAAALAQLNASLEDRVAQRTAELERARDEALEASRAKERFLSNMSHEIRTPMNGMLGALELMGRTPLDATQARYIEVASASGEALLAVINEVLDFAKIRAERLELASEPIDVNAIARSVTTLFSAVAQRKALALRLDADPALAGWRLGDPLRLRQVLMNLVGNALKFTQRGEVVVATRLRADGGVGFEVADSGPGIAPAEHERIFEPFVQAGTTPWHSLGGTGLGLAISRHLVQAMGGELTLASVEGEGARFSFALRLPPAEVPAPGVSVAPAAVGAGASLSGRVLLVEDNSVNRLVANAMLQTLGLDVVEAEDGEQALEQLATQAFAVVLMDCQMPVMDGYEATQRLRQIEREQRRPRLPVVAFTANALSGEVERCLAAGMDAHLSKPFTLEQLRDTLAPWLTR